jgi:membrane protease YdiL (CAAX protease family)
MEMSKQEEPEASFSLRTIGALEIASVTLSVLITVWAIIPLQLNHPGLVALPGLFALILMIHSHRVRRETLHDLGFTMRYFGRAILLLALPMIIGGAVLIAVGSLHGSFQVKSRFWTSLALLPLWGLTQQYILQGFIYRRLRFVLADENASAGEQVKRTQLAILLTAILFALVHAPNLPLMALAFLGGLVWSWVYERAPNLFALGLSHALMSAIVLLSLPAHSMRIGYEYFIYRAF